MKRTIRVDPRPGHLPFVAFVRRHSLVGTGALLSVVLSGIIYATDHVNDDTLCCGRAFY